MALQEFHYDVGKQLKVTADMLQVWNKDGVFVVRRMFPHNEIKLLERNLQCEEMKSAISYVDDGAGGKSGIALWSNEGNSMSGYMARCEKVVRTAEKLLGGGVFHYHSSLVHKVERTGGMWRWHQDYGYWYKNGLLFPDLLTVWVAVDACNLENACLQVIPGSHHCGKMEHFPCGGQFQADMDRVTRLSQLLPVVPVILQPGDAIFLHANILHKSDKNSSDRRRWALQLVYCTIENHPIQPHRPMATVPDSLLSQCREFSMTDVKFLRLDEDPASHKSKL